MKFKILYCNKDIIIDKNVYVFYWFWCIGVCVFMIKFWVMCVVKVFEWCIL